MNHLRDALEWFTDVRRGGEASGSWPDPDADHIPPQQNVGEHPAPFSLAWALLAWGG